MSLGSEALFGDGLLNPNLNIVANTSLVPTTVKMSLRAEADHVLSNESQGLHSNEMTIAKTIKMPVDTKVIQLTNELADSNLEIITSTSIEPTLSTTLDTENLHLLTHELPDLNLELFYQHKFLRAPSLPEATP
jgi:hypothetical protein